MQLSAFPFARLLICLALGALTVACDADKKSDKKSSPPHQTAPVSPPAPVSVTPSHPGSQEIEKLTSARTRIVWSQYQKPKSADPYSNNDNHFLMGLDTRDGQGARPILAVQGNYSRPLITTDGKSILYTDKRLTRDKDNNKQYNPVIRLTDWRGQEPKKLADGYAVESWRDPVSGLEWVYAIRDLVPSTRIAIEAKKLIRFPLTDPSKEEVVWDQTAVSPDNIQLSRDGTRASGQFPWPNVGQFLLGGRRDFKKLITGCWPSLAPDNSQISWGLDGEHREATFFADDGAKTWTLKLASQGELAKGEIYHPRWTSHPRFITLTGPYLGEMVPGAGSVIGKGGLTADVYIGKLNDKLDAFEGWVCVDKNALGDAYPDVWIEGGNEAVLTHFPQKSGKTAGPPATAAQGDQTGLIFKWEDRNQNNTVRLANGTQLDCSLDTRGAARYGRRLDLLLDSGSFQPKPEASAALTAVLSGDHAASVSFLLSFDDPKSSGSGVLAQFPAFTLGVAEGKLTASSSLHTASLPLPPTSPIRVVVTQSASGALTLSIRSSTETQQATSVTGTPSPAGSDILLGGGGILGGLRALAVFDRELAPAEIQTLFTSTPADSSPPPARIRLRGKLVETSPMPTEEAINPYTSAMVSCIYDVISISEGAYKEKQILIKHWGMLTKKNATGFPRTLGQEYDLLVEPLSAHPELKGDRSMELDVFDLDPYYDIATPSVAN
jgi:hypothetical protein